ncbi:hypothetical protein H9Q09_01025 [Aurantimonas sp. DM33-3]|uniref:hypothetical protein n=1 Tax=Aurantimonas sp. DM33-3 TaxID=2766955 RepID=UPI001651CF44|nr:hypothetical protein [Aurantimonas sp. DM33-3]MBC6714767.1 hypothetical protein [Aurantimonas sp. DM33-3]
MLGRCANCGHVTHIDNLDAKPERLAGPGNMLERMFPALRRRKIWGAADGEDFDRLECRRCYGGGFSEGHSELIAP